VEIEEIKAFLEQLQSFPDDESWEEDWIETLRSAVNALGDDLHRKQYPCVWTGEDPTRFQIDPEIARLLFGSIGKNFFFGATILSLVARTSPDVVESIVEEGLDSVDPLNIRNTCELIFETQRPMHKQKVRALFEHHPDLRDEVLMAMYVFKALDDIAWLKQLLQRTDDEDLRGYCLELLAELD